MMRLWLTGFACDWHCSGRSKFAQCGRLADGSSSRAKIGDAPIAGLPDSLSPKTPAASPCSSLSRFTRKVERRDAAQALPGCCLDSQIVRTHNHYEVVRLDEFRKTVSFNENSRCFDTTERILDSVFNLTVCRDHPVHVRCARIPIAPGVFSRSVGQLSP